MITSGITVEGTGQPVSAAGPQGPSAYDVAVQNGFTGSVTQWLASLQGQTADPTALNAAVSRASVQADNSQASAQAAAGSVVTATGILATITARISDAVSTAVATLTTALNAAVTSASNYATGAGQSATAAAGSATTASGAATSATTQASAASTSASASAGSATAAAGSATAAAGSATAAAGSVITAQKWAMQASGTVDGASYSAKYYALQAAASAQSAAAGGVAPSGTFTAGHFMFANNASGSSAVDGGAPGDAAFKNTGTGAGTLAAGDDSRITGAAQKSANLTDLPAPAVALAALGGVSVAALSTALTDLRYLFLLTAARFSLSLGMVNGAVDPLSDLTHINTAASSGYAFNAATGTVSLASSVGTTFLTVSTASQGISGGDSSGNGFANAFDGSYNSSFWGSSQTSSAMINAAFVGQDFGAGNSYAVSQIVSYINYGAGDAPSSVAVQVADTSGGSLGSWSTVQTYTPPTAQNSLFVMAIPASAGAHRAWRVVALSASTSGSAGRFTVMEMAFQITIPVGSTVSNASQAIAYSSTNGYGPTNAFDGAYNTYWYSAEQSSAVNGVSWIGQDFGVGNTYAISQITHVTWAGGGNGAAPSSVLLQYTDSANTTSGSWTTVGAYSLNTNSSGVTVISVPSSTGAHRAWRLLANSVVTPAATSWAVTEIQFQIAGTLATVSNAAQAISDSDYSASYAKTFAFDGVTISPSGSSFWVSNNASGTVNQSWIGQDFGSGNAFAVTNVQFTSGGNAQNTFGTGVFQYTDSTTPNASATWTTVATYALPTAVNTTVNLPVPTSAGSHRAWRMVASTGNPANPGVGELTLQVFLATQQVSRPAQATSNGDAANQPALAANDNNGLSSWVASQAAGSSSGAAAIEQDFGSGNTATLTAFTVTNGGSAGYAPSSVLLQWTDAATPNASATWTTVGTYAFNTAAYVTQTFAVPTSAGAHRAWRLLANANPASGPWTIAEWSLYAVAPAVTGYVLQSSDYALGLTNPSKVQGLIHVDGSSGAFTLNTDLVVSVSRCAGAQFTTGTLKLIDSLPDGSRLYDTGQVDVSGQPSGNTGTLKITTANGKSVVTTGYIVLEAA